MTEILLQSALAESRSAELTTSVAQLRERCAAEHADKATTLVECESCLQQLLSSIRARYLENTASEQQPPEWFSSRRAFLTQLEALFTEALERRLDPRDIDARVQEERSRWYAENVRASLLRLMVEDPAGREAVFEKLEDAPADLSGLVADIAQVISASPMISREAADGADVRQRLLAAKDPEARIEVLKQAFLSTGDDIPDEHQKYLEMLQNSLSMEQVVDRILEERQAAVASREHEEKLKQKLYELRRARAAHELQKSRRERKRARLAEQVDVPDELYDLPPCFACGRTPDTRDFLCCPICTILVRYNIPDAKPTIFCSDHDDPSELNKGRHAATHTCAAGDTCISSSSSSDQTDHTPTLCFCRECLSSLKITSTFCSPSCADTNFQRHREEVHMPARKQLNLIITDREQLEYFPADDNNTRYRAKDIAAHVIPYEEAASRWEEENHVKLQRA
ncbi:hypothetical protein B0T16DRAFT_314460 [Cercophora newfieldiana]|uniref:Uncharacterized protein n=1 Tax=Cercophora newfieldiana TaxID=92897 RepID=A0AA39YPV1_9PEZI|nr:hypothetical protein B0T16DRAFT_314460 [Cercophora newfieldiana]